MTTFFGFRHLGALDWAAAQGLIVDQVIDHLDPQIIQPGDVVIRTLPNSFSSASVSARRALSAFESRFATQLARAGIIR